MKKYINTLKNDIPAGMVVFLVALPLCLGIASASGANAFSGVITGVIGGVVVTLFSKSKFGVSGPAAGMITIVLVAIESLGFSGFLTAMVIAGIMQFLLGQFKLGFIAHFIPHSVIIGMLASIGIVLILKQVPHAVGFDTGNVGEYDFKEHDSGSNTFKQIQMAWKYSNSGAILISLVSLAIMFFWNMKFLKRYKFFQLVPSALIVVAVGIVINLIYMNYYHDMKLESFHMVHLPYPLINGVESFKNGDFSSLSGIYSGLITFPDFTTVTNSKVWTTAIVIALVASVQTLLTVEATDNLDPEKNVTPPNAELKAQGIGNLLSGLLGGIPIAQVIVRSSANINAGAKSKMGSFFHGVFLLIIVLIFPQIMNLIPLASLAVILIVLGYKLANPVLFVNTWKEGWEQFVPFIVTIVAIIFSDLLKGIGIGLAVAMITILRSNYQVAFKLSEKNGIHRLSFIFVVSFLNKGNLALKLHDLPENSALIIDAKKCHFISHDILELIRDFTNIVAVRKNINVELVGFERYDIHNHPSDTVKETKTRTVLEARVSKGMSSLPVFSNNIAFEFKGGTN